jgi:hypothetical protein
MMRSLRMAAAALAAVAIVGSTATAQAAALPSANTITFAGTSAAPSAQDIVMNWAGTCTNPGGLVEAFIDGPAGGRGQTVCDQAGTFRLQVLADGYAARGLQFGQNFNYWVVLLTFQGSSLNGPATELSGTATLR